MKNKKNKMKLPIVLFAAALVIACELLLVIPKVKGRVDSNLSAVRLASLECIPQYVDSSVDQYYKNNIKDKNGKDLGSGTVISVKDTARVRPAISFTYPVNINFTKLTGKFAAINFIPGENKKADPIINVRILGDNNTIIFKSDWNVAQIAELVVDEPINKLRNVTIELSCSENIRAKALELAMVDFVVSKDDAKPQAASKEENEAMNKALIGSFGGSFDKGGSAYKETIITIKSVKDGNIQEAVISLSNGKDITGTFSAHGTINYETGVVNFIPDKWINRPNIEKLGKDSESQYAYFPIYARLNDKQNIMKEMRINLIVKKLLEGGKK